MFGRFRPAGWRRQERKTSKGFTLIEMGIVLALMGIAIFYALSKMSATNDTSKSQAFTQDFSSIVINTKRVYQTQTDYNGISVTTLKNNSVFPSLWNVGGTITGPWTGAVTVAAGTLATANDSAAITIPNVPSANCTEIVRQLSGGIDKIDVAGTNVKPYQGSLNIPTLGTQCASASSVSVVFTFGKL